jgi:hypothetical protein
MYMCNYFRPDLPCAMLAIICVWDFLPCEKVIMASPRDGFVLPHLQVPRNVWLHILWR